MTLLRAAGHSDWRDARGPMGFTQRQAGGKFTRDEAEAFIERLQQAESDAGSDADTDSDAKSDAASGAASGTAAAGASADSPVRPTVKRSAAEQALRRMPTEQLAGELQRRGWIVIEP